MSEQKGRRMNIIAQPNSFHNIYESRILSSQSRFVYSYPLCTSASKRQEPLLMSSRKSPQHSQIYVIKNQKTKQIKKQKESFYSPLKQNVRPKSLDFKNNLFEKLASKIQRKRQTQSKKNNEVISEYYDETGNKQNSNGSNCLNKKKDGDPSSKNNILNSKISHIAKNRYEKGKTDNIEQKHQIKFNKLKSKISTKKSNEQVDFVRTSDADFKITKNSLEMCPIL